MAIVTCVSILVEGSRTKSCRVVSINIVTLFRQLLFNESWLNIAIQPSCDICNSSELTSPQIPCPREYSKDVSMHTY